MNVRIIVYKKRKTLTICVCVKQLMPVLRDHERADDPDGALCGEHDRITVKSVTQPMLCQSRRYLDIVGCGAMKYAPLKKPKAWQNGLYRTLCCRSSMFGLCCGNDLYAACDDDGMGVGATVE